MAPQAPAERHHEQAVGRADREQVEDHGLERQQQRAERAHEHEVGDREHAEHEPGEDAVGAVDEVDARRRAAAGVDARAAEARVRDVAVAEAARELLGLVGAVVVPGRDDDAGVAARRIGRQVGRQAGVGRRLHDRDLGVGAHLGDEPADRGLGLADAARAPAVDDGDQRRDRARPERALEQLQALHRLRRARAGPCSSRASARGTAPAARRARGSRR